MTVRWALFWGDCIVLYVSLFLALFIRFQAIPTQEVYIQHALPMTLIFIVWVVVWYIAGLYEDRIGLLQSQLLSVLFRTQLINAGIASVFFYVVPVFDITPKTLLLVFVIMSFGGLALWRWFVFWCISRRQQKSAILIGAGDEVEELFNKVNSERRFGLKFVSKINVNTIDGFDIQSDIVDRIHTDAVSTIVIDTEHAAIRPVLPKLYNLIFSHVHFIDMHKVYEEVFDRVPLSLVQYSWFLENISVTRRFSYEFLKRLLDLLVSVPAFLVSLIVYPFVIAAIMLEDGGPIFITQERIGEHNRTFRLVKFRTMTGNDSGDETLKSTLRVTKVGAFLRKTRIDELPQLWDVVRGDLSLIGPRPELPALVSHYVATVPFYNIRHLIKPGLSGWAQVYHQAHPHHGADVEETRNKLSYDLYYLKNRSFLLDFTIVLKTIRIVCSRVGK